MHTYKIVFSGTTGAGKTTAIGAVSETIPVKTDVRNTDELLQKDYTTVGFDYGFIELANGDTVKLFGTPGQSRFDFMWKIIAKDALGIIILIDNSRPKPVDDLAMYLEGFAEELKVSPCVVGVGRMEKNASPSLDEFSHFIASKGLILPLIPVDVRKSQDVNLLINMLVAQAEVDLRD